MSKGQGGQLQARTWKQGAHGRYWRPLFCIALLMLVQAASAVARADSSVIVLTVRSLDGDDALARRWSNALRTGARHVAGWQVSDNEVSLAQMSLAHGCTEPNASCMADIAQTLGVDRLLYGTSRLTDGGLQLTLYNFDAVTGQVEGSHEETVSADALAPEAIEQTATRFALQAAGQAGPGSIEVHSNRPGAEVSLDGRAAGSIGEDGTLRIEEVAPGAHHLRVAAGGASEDRDLTVEPGKASQTEVNLAATSLPPPVIAEPVQPEPVVAPKNVSTGVSDAKLRRLRIAGWTTVSLGLGLFVGTVAVWAKLDNINNDPNMKEYRSMFAKPDGSGGGVSDVCVLARQDTTSSLASHVASQCDAGDRLQTLQWVFLVPAIASAITGTTLLLRERGLRNRRDVSLSPYAGRGRAGLVAHMRF